MFSKRYAPETGLCVCERQRQTYTETGSCLCEATSAWVEAWQMKERGSSSSILLVSNFAILHFVNTTVFTSQINLHKISV